MLLVILLLVLRQVMLGAAINDAVNDAIFNAVSHETIGKLTLKERIPSLSTATRSYVANFVVSCILLAVQ